MPHPSLPRKPKPLPAAIPGASPVCARADQIQACIFPREVHGRARRPRRAVLAGFPDLLSPSTPTRRGRLAPPGALLSNQGAPKVEAEGRKVHKPEMRPHGEGRTSARPKGKWRAGQRLDRAWGVRKHSPPPRGGGRPVEGLPMESCLRSKWKGRRGGTAGCRICMASTLSIRKLLIHSFSVLSRAGRDGRAQYSPRRGPCRFPSSIHGRPIHARATPLSEGGRILVPSLILAFAEFGIRLH